MPVTVTNDTLPAAGAKIAVASDGTQDWQVILPGFDRAGTLTPDSVANPHPVQVGDGTHTMPTADAPARALQVTPGDGTNVTPAGDAAARARFQKLTDGTNTAAVKGASTAAAATDPAVVVALSPSSPIPTGTNAIGTVTVSNLPATQPVSGTVAVSNFPATQPVSAASLPLPTGAATDRATAAAPNASRLTDGAAFYDAAKTGQLPAALVGGRVDANNGAWLGSTAPTVGSKTSASSLPVVIASDQTSVPVTGIGAAAATADAVANPTLGLLQSMLSAFNGTTWDRVRAGVVGVQATFTGILSTIGMARYNATSPTLADGNIAPLQATTTGALKVVLADVQTAALDLTSTPSNSASTTTVSSTVTGLSKASAITIIAKNQGSTSGTLDLTLQDSPDGGTTWFDFWHLPQLAAGAASNVLAYVPGINDVVTPIGQGTAGAPGVVLAAGSKRGGHPFDAMRLVMTTGSGVSASVSQSVKVYVTQPTP